MNTFNAIRMAFLVGLGALLNGCGGEDAPGSVDVPQCAGSRTCDAGESGQSQNQSLPVVRLCPSSLAFDTVYSGGAGSGEYVKVQFDTLAMRYRMTFVESPVPTAPRQVRQTRAGLTIEGSMREMTTLPTAEQNRCALQLLDGATADGNYRVGINPRNPPILFVGQGVVGGGIPGATISFTPLGLLNVVPERTFDFYPFVGFSALETDFGKIAGTYNELGFRMTPSASPDGQPFGTGWRMDGLQTQARLDASGTCTALDATGQPGNHCLSTGTPWQPRKNADGSTDTAFESGPAIPPAAGLGSLLYPALGKVLQIGLGENKTKGILIAGRLRGDVVPLVVRVGYTNATDQNLDWLLSAVLDDQVGISLMAPQRNVAPNALDGGYIGTNSAFAYISTIVQGTRALFVDPPTQRPLSDFGLDFAQGTPGLIGATMITDYQSGLPLHAGDSGAMIAVGGLYGLLFNRTGNAPFFGIGAVVQ